ncbi:hypothetical protein ACJRO7_035662 [Eucalyptus globulus]|uniref:Uncharacterized protein n=1 Tax=Eucalyptus globulus TaxID=34317 RepID=A0ABD3JDL4_EUCGL
MSTPNVHILFFTIFTGLLLSTLCDINQTQNDVALFIFGDALNDAGTNNYINTTAFFRANFSPCDETFFHYPTGRITDGRIMADFIAEYAKLPLIPPYLQLKNDEFVGGANFASIGAGALPETFAGFVVDFKTQLKQFESLVKNLRDNLGDKKAERIVLDGFYFISIGLNDYVAVLNNPALFQSVSMEDYVGMGVGNISTVLEGIYKVGARKFGFSTMLHLGCLPTIRLATRNGSCSRQGIELTKLHNTAFPATLTKLESQLQGFKYSLFDLYTSLTKRIQHPSTYGQPFALSLRTLIFFLDLKHLDGKTACCGSGPFGGNYSCGGMRGVREYSMCPNPTDYVFFDSNHLSERAYHQFAQLIWNGSSPTTKPYNLEALFKHGNV